MSSQELKELLTNSDLNNEEELTTKLRAFYPGLTDEQIKKQLQMETFNASLDALREYEREKEKEKQKEEVRIWLKLLLEMKDEIKPVLKELL